MKQAIAPKDQDRRFANHAIIISSLLAGGVVGAGIATASAFRSTGLGVPMAVVGFVGLGLVGTVFRCRLWWSVADAVVQRTAPILFLAAASLAILTVI